ncbi:protein of unknown function [Pseudomonas mediterranea]
MVQSSMGHRDGLIELLEPISQKENHHASSFFYFYLATLSGVIRPCQRVRSCPVCRQWRHPGR